MSHCHFCQRHFANDQGAKAHLRWCLNYLKGKTDTSIRGWAVERASQTAKRQFPQSQTVPEVVQSSNPFGGFLEQLTQQFAGPDETTRVKQKRQAMLADLCARLVDWYHPLEGVITPEMAAAAKVAILEELGMLAIDDMQQSELTLRGTVIRNRIFAPYLRRQQEDKNRKLTTHKEELRRSQKDTDRQTRRTTRKAVLIELGVSRALKAGSSRGLPIRVLRLLEWEVRGRLEALLIGHETQGQAKETIEAAIEGPLWEWTTRMEQLEAVKRERVVDECLAVAAPVAAATWPWVKDVVIKHLCEKFGIQPSPERETNKERASRETSSTANREHPSGPTVNPDEMAGTSEPVKLKRAAS